LKKLKSPVNKIAKEFEKPLTMKRPFNSQNRASYLAMGTALHSTFAKLQKQEETGYATTNGVLKA